LTTAKANQANAKANLDDVNAQHNAVRGKADAMSTAAAVAAAPGLAPAADSLWDPAKAFPAPPDQFSTAI
jgi:hypothetical protein